MDKHGKFIVIDGMDGSGKGTQIELLKKRLEGQKVLFTREPGGSPKAEEVRNLILQTGGPASNAICDFFLFWAARGSHIEDVITPARAQGNHVICDRYDSSTYAFQLLGEQSEEWMTKLFHFIRKRLPPENYHPDAYIVLDLPAAVAYERRKKDAEKEKDRFDLKPLEYHERVRTGFKSFAQQYGPVYFIDAERTPEEIHTDMWNTISQVLTS